MRRGVRARRVVRRFELWSVAKLAFFFHLCCGFFSLLVGVGLWFVADRVGTRRQMESFLGDLLGTKNFELFGDKLLRAAAGVTGALVLLATVGTVLMAFVYNMLSGIFGGVVVSVLQERAPEPGTRALADPAQVRAAHRRRRRRRRRLVKLFRRPAVAASANPRPASGPGSPDPTTVSAPAYAADGGAAGPVAETPGVPDADWLAAAVDPTGSWMAPGGR